MSFFCKYCNKKIGTLSNYGTKELPLCFSCKEMSKEGKPLNSLFDCEKPLEQNNLKTDDVNKSTWWSWNVGVVKDDNAPLLYSQRSLIGFSIFFNPFFGSILFAINLRKVNKEKFVVPVILSGILWLALTVWFLSYGMLSGVIYLANMVGGTFLVRFIWPYLLGKELKYRQQKIFIPLMISIFLMLSYIVLLVVFYKPVP